MKLSVLEDIDLTSEPYIIIGVSAGPDSMALLNLIKTKINNQIICVHINHNVRKQSIKEELYLKKYCLKNNIIFECSTIKEYNENNFENEARKKRYAFYKQIIQKYNCHYLFLAHHADDLMETILMKIARGSNIEGYAGIKKINYNHDYTIVRPLLDYTKQDIINYNKINNIKYFMDKTNKNPNYTRNNFRLKIIPILKKSDQFVHKQFIKYSNTLLEYDNYIKKIINEIKPKIYNNYLDINKFKKLDAFLQKNLLFNILNNLYDNKDNIIKEQHVYNIINVIYNDKPNIIINLPKNIVVKKEYLKLFFESKIKIDNYKSKLENEVIINNFIIKKINSSQDDGNDICRLNSSDLSLPLYIRNKKDGDIIYLKGTTGKKKVKDIFIDKKIPLLERKIYPLLVDNNDNILWIPCVKKSQFNKKKNENYDIILKCYERKEENEK